MKKVPFIILVVFECLLDLIAVGMLLSFLGVFSYLIAMGVIALVLIPAFKKLKNSQDETEKRKRKQPEPHPAVRVAFAEPGYRRYCKSLQNPAMARRI